MSLKLLNKLLTVLILIFSLYIFISILYGVLFSNDSQSEVLNIFSPGITIFQSFSLLSFYIPIYLVFCIFFLYSPKHKPQSYFYLSTSLVPFLTINLLVKIVISNNPGTLAYSFINAFGKNISIMFVIAILFLEAIIIYSLKRFWFDELSVKKIENETENKVDLIGTDLSTFNQEEVLNENADFESESQEESEYPIESFEEVVEPPSVNDIIEELKSDEYEFNNEEEPELLEVVDESEDYSVESGAIEEEVGPEPGLKNKVEKKTYAIPTEGLLKEYSNQDYEKIDEETARAAEVLRTSLEEFNIEAEVTGIRKGPVVTMFEILPAPGVKISKIVNLSDNIALRLAASRLRIVAPIPGKHAVGIEVPNKKRFIVSFKEIIESNKFNKNDYNIPIVLGKDITGDSQIIDLTQTPHLLIAGATGSGKSVCVNSIITSILYKKKPDEVKLLLIDPKIVELKFYNDIPHLLTPVITDPKKAFQALQYCIYEMERRYSLLDSLGVRDIASFNKKVKTKRLTTEKLPYIVIIIDEFADLMATSGKELETTLSRLAAMSRAVGLHIVLATQRPSIDVITGLIKANIPSRIAFMVAGKFDSRIIIDSVGAEKLLGKGDMLFTSSWNPFPSRIQGAFLSEEEVERVTNYAKTLGEPDYIDDEIFIEDEDGQIGLFANGTDDPLMEKALEIIATAGKASASYLQRRLKIGYNRAARIVEEMEARGIVGPQQGSKAREVLHIPDKLKI